MNHFCQDKFYFVPDACLLQTREFVLFYIFHSTNILSLRNTLWLSDSLKFLLAGLPKFRTGSNFCWQAFRSFGQAQIFVGRPSTSETCPLFLLADLLPLKLACYFFWQTFYHRNLPAIFVGRLSTTETCLLFLLANVLQLKTALNFY